MILWFLASKQGVIFAIFEKHTFSLNSRISVLSFPFYSNSVIHSIKQTIRSKHSYQPDLLFL